MDSFYLTGELQALCPPKAMYDVIVGNVRGARAANDPDKSRHEAMAHGKQGRDSEITGRGSVHVHAESIGICMMRLVRDTKKSTLRSRIRCFTEFTSIQRLIKAELKGN